MSEIEADRAQLLSIATGLRDLTDRLTEVADRYAGSPREDLASDLYEVERSLRGADRRLQRMLRSLR